VISGDGRIDQIASERAQPRQCLLLMEPASLLNQLFPPQELPQASAFRLPTERQRHRAFRRNKVMRGYRRDASLPACLDVDPDFLVYGLRVSAMAVPLSQTRVPRLIACAL
jgi:hypothetical protein